MSGRSDTAGLTVLSRAFAILDTFVDRPEQTHGSITRATGFSPATVHRLLAEMVAWGAVERTAWGRYRIGMQLWRLGSQAPAGRALRDLALPFLQDLLEVTHEVVHLVVLDGRQVLYIEKLEARPDIAVQSQVGRRLPLHATGPGKVLLAHAPAPLLDEVIAAGLDRHAKRTITDPRALRQALAAIRQQGFCLSRDEMTDGTSSVAAPIRDARNQVIAAVSVVVPSDDRSLTLLVPPVRMAALGLSRALAGPPPES